MNKVIIKRACFMLYLFLVPVLSMHSEEDRKLGLHSDGGNWKFYPANNINNKLPNVLLIGDSIMNGYRQHVIKKLNSKANVDCWLTPLHLKSKELHADLKKVVAFRKYDVIHFNIGLHGWPKGRILSEEYPVLLQKYVDILKQEAPHSKLIWCSITQVHERNKKELNREINPTIVERNKIALEIMNNSGITVNDLYGLMSQHLDLVRGDRFHWKGNKGICPVGLMPF